MPSDGLNVEQVCPPPTLGLVEGLDPALPEYPAAAAPSLRNIRVAEGKWTTRRGMALWEAIGGAGDVRGLWDHYEAAGTRIRLAAQGTGAAGALFDFKEGTDSNFNAASGGTSLGGTSEPYFQGVSLNDAFYFTDRAEGLRKYVESASTQVALVAQPVAPVAAPTVVARPYGYLESWNGNSGVAPFGWTESNAADYAILDDTAAKPAPGGGRTVVLDILATGAVGDTITENVTSEAIPSNTIAYWLNQERNRFHQLFEFGITQVTDFNQPHRNPSPNEWYPIFIDVGNITSINFKRFRCVNAPSEEFNDWISPLYLPGFLQGQYRWCYTHYDPATGEESEPSAIANNGNPVDLSTVGVTGQRGSAAAFNKSAVLTFTADPGDASTTKIRIYRQGGTASLTLDANGREVWVRVGEVFDQSTTVSGAHSAGGGTLTVASATNLAAGDTLVIDKGIAGQEEYVTIASLLGAVATLKEPLLFNHSNGDTVQVAFLDNVSNTAAATLLGGGAIIQRERDDPPTAAKFVRRSPDGRLVLLNWTRGSAVKPTGVAWSNRATPDRPTDYEVFPTGVDPQTRRDPLQGWDTEIMGDSSDVEIVWGDYFQGRLICLTQTNIYSIEALSQAEWGPSSIQKLAGVGCIARDSAAECDGLLVWVSDGPTVWMWDGRSAPQNITHQRVTSTLQSAPVAHYKKWFAVYHATEEGRYYRLYMAPSGQTEPTLRLDYNLGQNAWEPVSVVDADGDAVAFRAASVRIGGSDAFELYAASSDGNVYEMETGDDDDGVAIDISLTTKRFDCGGYIGMLHTLFLRLEGVDDDGELTVTAGGSEYGEVSQTYTLDFDATGDKEIKVRLHRTLLGRWFSLSVTGSVSNRPALREARLLWQPFRAGRVSV